MSLTVEYSDLAYSVIHFMATSLLVALQVAKTTYP